MKENASGRLETDASTGATDSALELTRAILHAPNCLRLLIDYEGRILEVSPAYAALMGYSAEELTRKNIAEIHGELDEAGVRREIEKSIQCGQRAFESSHRKKDGSIVLFEVDCSAIAAQGKRYLSCFVRDITTRRATETALVKSEAQLMAASRIGKIAYWEYDIANDLFTFNDPFYAIFGTSVEEVGSYQLTARQYEERFVHPDDRPIVLCHAKRAMASKDQRFHEGFEHRMLYADGRTGYVAVYHFLAKDEKGKTIKTYGANQDITERKKAERTLIHTNRILHSIREVNKLIKSEEDADSLLRKTARNLISDRGFEDSWIALTEESGRIRKIVTPHADNLMREAYIPPEKLKWIEEMSQLDSDAPSVPLHWETRRYDFEANGKPYSTLCFPIVFHNRHFGYLSITAQTWLIKPTEEQELSQELANDLAYALFSFELEEQKSRALRELIEAKDIAESANRAKDEFLAVISHEIRTPLNPILGYVHLLKRRHPEEKSQVYLESIERAAQQQLSLIDNILNFTRLDRGRITPTTGRFHLRQICHQAVCDARQSRRDLNFQLRDDPRLRTVPATLAVSADKNMLQELLSNLLSNACKYTPSGEVVLCIGYEDTPNPIKTFHFEVKDTGIGISPNTQSKLFTPFTQADTSYTRKYEGAGLGLAICKKLVDLMGGDIGVESREGEGSRFWFTLKLPIVEKAPEPTNPEQPRVDECLSAINGKNVLLVEDKADNSELARFLLEGYGATVTIAENGKRAVELCQSGSYDIIFMDLAMPVLDGFEASARIRNLDNPNRSAPIVVLTADASPDTEKRCSEFGFKKYLTKPIDVSKLAEAMHEALLTG